MGSIQKFYEKTWFMWVMLIFFAPIGIFLMYQYKRFNPTARLILSIFSGLVFISIIATNNISNNVETNGSAYKQSDSEQGSTSVAVQSTRGNVYDRNGVLLATNELSYSVVMEDTAIPDDESNDIINKLIKIIEDNGDSLYNEFYIRQNESGKLEFTVEGSALTQFKKNAFTNVLKDGNLTEEQLNATAQNVYEFLRIGTNNGYTHMFHISDKYSVEDTLKIMSVRYALFCNSPKYLQITVAAKVSDATVAAVMESKADLKGVKIQQQTSRIYEDTTPTP
jgi:penicillin-binding protein 2